MPYNARFKASRASQYRGTSMSTLSLTLNDPRQTHRAAAAASASVSNGYQVANASQLGTYPPNCIIEVNEEVDELEVKDEPSSAGSCTPARPLRKVDRYSNLGRKVNPSQQTNDASPFEPADFADRGGKGKHMRLPGLSANNHSLETIHSGLELDIRGSTIPPQSKSSSTAEVLAPPSEPPRSISPRTLTPSHLDNLSSRFLRSPPFQAALANWSTHSIPLASEGEVAAFTQGMALDVPELFAHVVTADANIAGHPVRCVSRSPRSSSGSGSGSGSSSSSQSPVGRSKGRREEENICISTNAKTLQIGACTFVNLPFGSTSSVRIDERLVAGRKRFVLEICVGMLAAGIVPDERKSIVGEEGKVREWVVVNVDVSELVWEVVGKAAMVEGVVEMGRGIEGGRHAWRGVTAGRGRTEDWDFEAEPEVDWTDPDVREAPEMVLSSRASSASDGRQVESGAVCQGGAIFRVAPPPALPTLSAAHTLLLNLLTSLISLHQSFFVLTPSSTSSTSSSRSSSRCVPSAFPPSLGSPVEAQYSITHISPTLQAAHSGDPILDGHLSANPASIQHELAEKLARGRTFEMNVIWGHTPKPNTNIDLDTKGDVEQSGKVKRRVEEIEQGTPKKPTDDAGGEGSPNWMKLIGVPMWEGERLRCWIGWLLDPEELEDGE